MIRKLAMAYGLIVFSAVALLVLPASGAALKLNSGEVLEGEPANFNAQGVVLKKPDGSYGTRVAWTNLTQETLKQIAANPKAKPFAEPFLEPDEAELAAREKKADVEIKVRLPERLERPDPKAGFGALTASGITMLGFILLYLANIYAGYEAGVFRNYHPALTCGVAAVAPVIGPIIFLCLPTRIKKSHDELAAESMAVHQAALAQAEAEAAAANAPTPEELAAQEAAAAAAAVAAAEAAKNAVTTYARGQTTFNRRFFETKFAGFLRMVPGEEERDKVIYIKSARGEYVGQRLSRIQPNELHLQVKQGDASTDVMIPFNEIYEVQVRPAHLAAPAPA